VDCKPFVLLATEQMSDIEMVIRQVCVTWRFEHHPFYRFGKHWCPLLSAKYLLPRELDLHQNFGNIGVFENWTKPDMLC